MMEKWCYTERGRRRKNTAQDRFGAQAEEGFREELASDTEQDLRWRGRRIFQFVKHAFSIFC